MINPNSKTSIYINDNLIDIVQINFWYNQQTFSGHSPYQAIKTLEKIAEQLYNNPQLDVTVDLYNALLRINYFGYYLSDEIFYDCPFPVYRYSSKNHYWGDTVRISNNGNRAEYEITRRLI